MDAETLIASGWKSEELVAYSTQIGLLWCRGKGTERVYGFLSEPRHANNRPDTVHGGLLMTFADIALGAGSAYAAGVPSVVTAQLQLQFAAAAKIGDFVTCRPEVIRKTSTLVFIRGLVCVDDKIVANADGIWKIQERRPKQSQASL